MKGLLGLAAVSGGAIAAGGDVANIAADAVSVGVLGVWMHQRLTALETKLEGIQGKLNKAEGFQAAMEVVSWFREEKTK